MFPEGFLWGTATAAYQVEGAPDADGKGASIWDTFAHSPGKTVNGDTGDIACDHYHLVESDIDLMAELGLNAYRFSLSWPRIQPDGRGGINQAGLDYYRRVLDGLAGKGITPAVTLFHWDLPQALEDEGGWPERDTAFRFAEYVHAVAQALGDRATMWITLNEPSVSSFLGYALGTRAPGRTDIVDGVLACHHLLLGHGLAIDALRAAQAQHAEVGITLDPIPVEAHSGDAADVEAAERVDGFLNRWYLDALFRGAYPDDMLDIYARAGARDFLRNDDMRAISGEIDFLGINYYTKQRVIRNDGRSECAGGAVTRPDAYPSVVRAAEVCDPAGSTPMGWAVRPEGLTEILLRVRDEYRDIPMYVTENGAAFHDYMGPDGEVHDPERIAYLDAHVRAAHDALAAGVDLRGYFVWTLLDNFEWADGYSRRFGLIYVHFPDQSRVFKDSAWWYSEVATENCV